MRGSSWYSTWSSEPTTGEYSRKFAYGPQSGDLLLEFFGPLHQFTDLSKPLPLKWLKFFHAPLILCYFFWASISNLKAITSAISHRPRTLWWFGCDANAGPENQSMLLSSPSLYFQPWAQIGGLKRLPLLLEAFLKGDLIMLFKIEAYPRRPLPDLPQWIWIFSISFQPLDYFFFLPFQSENLSN